MWQYNSYHQRAALHWIDMLWLVSCFLICCMLTDFYSNSALSRLTFSIRFLFLTETWIQLGTCSACNCCNNLEPEQLLRRVEVEVQRPAWQYLGHSGGSLRSQSRGRYWETKQYRKYTNRTQKSKQHKIQQTTLVQSPVTAFTQETSWAYSTVLPSSQTTVRKMLEDFSSFI